jgi:hypothetical protein
MIKKILILLIFFFFNQIVFSQNFPKYYFRWPVDGKHTVSDNFGEIRPAHFHTGLDVNASYGQNIFAAADGFISRINISSDGYGTALYIDHPNGYTTVYGHMSALAPEIAEYVAKAQYEKQVFEMNLYPPSDLFPVKKGQIIGNVGNSGHSYAPHLHFEIRETESENPTNPLLFFQKSVDNLPPKIFSLEIFPLTAKSSVNENHKSQIFAVSEKNGNYVLKNQPKVSGEIGFAIEAIDCAEGGSRRLNIFAAKLFVDGIFQAGFEFDKLSFRNMADVNSFCDYENLTNSGKKMMKFFSAPGNHLNIFDFANNRGILKFNDNQTHLVKIIVSDEYQNKSTLTFDVESQKSDLKIAISKNNSRTAKFDSAFYLIRPDFRMEIPANTLYDDCSVYFSQTADFHEFVSDIYSVGNPNIPVSQPFTVSIRPKSISEQTENKTVVVRIAKNETLISEDGDWINGFISAECKNFGRFALALDTVAPEIFPLDFKTGDNFTKRREISFKITDNLSGIDKYSGFIDSKWVLFKYDAKNSKITYTFDNQINYNQNHTLKISVTDKKNNESVFLTRFFK